MTMDSESELSAGLAESATKCSCPKREPFRYSSKMWRKFPYHTSDCELYPASRCCTHNSSFCGRYMNRLLRACETTKAVRSPADEVLPGCPFSGPTPNVLPVEMWRKIIGYLNNNDAYHYALSESSSFFRTLLADHEPYDYMIALFQRGLLDSLEGLPPDDGFWRERYRATVESFSCFRCFAQLLPSLENPAFAHGTWQDRIHREAEKLGRAAGFSTYVLREPFLYSRTDILDVQCCNVDPRAQSRDQKISNIIFTFLGQPGTPYLGGSFRLLIHFPERFPFEPYQARMLRKIISPYFTRHGEFYHPFSKTLHTQYDPESFWRPVNEITLVIQLVGQYLSLSVPVLNEEEFYPAKAMLGQMVNAEVGKLFNEDRELFDLLAQRYTHEYAIDV